ncbi:GM20480 [Drosophila sechellia]|uniref:GM20480 n=1 Tax=Drosophila sechellia TaxID=7238 RepID=B4HN28_DROSE|nr:GM20480 [Drosophila sechellia]
MIVVQRDAILVVNLFLILMLILSTAPSSAIDDHWREQQQQQPAWHNWTESPLMKCRLALNGLNSIWGHDDEEEEEEEEDAAHTRSG